jgi:acyl-homoserine-lactone acylase
VVDGKTIPMKGNKVTVQEKTSGGLQSVTRTLYSTRYGPVFNSIEGIPLPWTSTTAWALGDVNGQNFRYLNHFFATDQAQSVRQYNHIERQYQGIPWVNSIAADREGHAYYTMDGAIPYVTDAKAKSCAAAGVGAGVFAATGLPFLDGSRSACEWSSSKKAAAPGLMPPDRIPTLKRSDYVENSNDSHWLANPHHPLVGFSRVIGDDGTERSMRTRMGLTMIEQRLRGTDGMPGKGFTLRDLTRVALNDRVYSAEIWRDPLVKFCRTHPVLVGSSGPVDVSAACPILARWSGRYDLDAPGAVLFRRFTENLFSTTTRVPTGTASGLWVGADAFFTHPFDRSNPVNTPNGLDTTNPLVGRALADAVNDLSSASIPLDATLRRYQYVTRAGQRIPIHGGPGDPYGVFNAISSAWQPPNGYPDVTHGSCFIAAMGFSGGSCPVRQYTFVTYSESENPSSPHNSDYTRAFSRKHWEPEPFCAAQVRREARSTKTIAAR